MARFSAIAATLATALLVAPAAQGLAPEQALSACTTFGDVCILFHDPVPGFGVTAVQTGGPVVAVLTWIHIELVTGPFVEVPIVTSPLLDPCAPFDNLATIDCWEVGPRTNLYGVTSGPVLACLVTVQMDVTALGHTVVGNVPIVSVHTPPDC